MEREEYVKVLKIYCDVCGKDITYSRYRESEVYPDGTHAVACYYNKNDWEMIVYDYYHNSFVSDEEREERNRNPIVKCSDVIKQASSLNDIPVPEFK